MMINHQEGDNMACKQIKFIELDDARNDLNAKGGAGGAIKFIKSLRPAQ